MGCADNLTKHIIEHEILNTVNKSNHQTFDQLVHPIVEDSYQEVVYNQNNRPINVTIYSDSSKTLKIREEIITYANCNKVATLTVVQYNAVGVEVERLVESYTYSGNKIVSLNKDYIKNV